MYRPGAKLLERLTRPIRTLVAPGGLILGYHRIADDSWDPLGLCTKRRHFREQLALLRTHLTPVSMRTLVDAVSEGHRTTGLVAVTFDDGYADFVECALPELQDAGVPATVFVTTGNPGQPFWWDEICCALGITKPARQPLDLEWGKPRTKIAIESNADSEKLAETARVLCRELLHSDRDDRIAVIEALRAWQGTAAGIAPGPRALSDAEVHFLANTDGIEIACHTVSHPMLADMPCDGQREEIQTNRAHLGDLSDGVSPCGLSYPNGSYSEATVALVRNLGFDYACGSYQDVIHGNTDPFRLPRLWVPDRPGTAFRRWLASWYGMRI